jgi:dTDP-L-rhamnose 4-epimerase
MVLPAATNADWPPAPASIYASTKLMQEYLLQQAFWGTRTQVGILRLQNVFGPGQSLSNAYTGVLCHFCSRLLRDQTVDVYEDGGIVRDFVYVEDVADAMERLSSLRIMPRQIIDIGSGRATTILETAQILCRLFGRPFDRVRITGQFRPGDVRCAFADISAAERWLGWTPSHGLEEGLARLVNWVTGAPIAAIAWDDQRKSRHGDCLVSAGRAN